MPRHVSFTRLCLSIVLAALAVALAGSQSARAISVPVLIQGVDLENGMAVVTGTADADVVEINGDVIRVGDDGTFVAAVDLSENVLVLELLESPTETVTLRIPIDVLVENGGEGILNDLVDAGISIDEPLHGFRVVDGEMPLVEGRVLNGSNLSLLEVNGIDVLHELGDDGLFSIDLGSSSTSSRESVTVVATDGRGVSQTSTFSATRVTSTIATRAGTSVSAAGARGVVIAKVAYDKRFPKRMLRMVVTVEDRRGFLIRGAALRLRAMPSTHVAGGPTRIGFTNRLGQARFAFKLRAKAFAAAAPQLLTVSTQAATPKAATARTVTIRLPAAVTW